MQIARRRCIVTADMADEYEPCGREDREKREATDEADMTVGSSTYSVHSALVLPRWRQFQEERQMGPVPTPKLPRRWQSTSAKSEYRIPDGLSWFLSIPQPCSTGQLGDADGLNIATASNVTLVLCANWNLAIWQLWGPST